MTSIAQPIEALSGQTLYCTAKEFNANFIIRYYPDSTKLGNHTLVGFARMCEIVGSRAINGVLERAMTSGADMQEVKLRRGIIFRFIAR